MRPVYLNYASTSPGVSPRVQAVLQAYLQNGGWHNAGRGPDGLEDAAVALEARLALCRLFGAEKPTQVIFTSGVTLSLNMALHGLLRPGHHVLATSLEHNAVARPLQLLQQSGVQVSYMPAAPDGSFDAQSIHAYVRPNTRLLVMPHASNVLGTILPYRECFAAAKQHGLFTVLDAAQTAGLVPLQMDDNTDVLAFTGHKGLGGLAGIGGMLLSSRAAGELRPWLAGGTGSASHELDMPAALPDRFEPGTQNTIGILSLKAAAEELLELGEETIRQREQALTARFLLGLEELPVTVYGTRSPAKSVPVVSLGLPGQDAGLVARQLYSRHGIVTRSGLHCSPLAHKTAGTFPAGTVRFSFGRQTTADDIDAALGALMDMGE